MRRSSDGGGRRRRRCGGVDDGDGGRADFSDAELADDAGDIATVAVARDLARGAAIPAGGGNEAEEEEEAHRILRVVQESDQIYWLRI